MRARGALLLGLVAYGAFLVAGLPAAVVTERIAAHAPRVAFADVSGTAWNGSSRVIVKAGAEAAVDRVEWSFQPLRLFTGEAAWAVRASKGGFVAKAVVARSIGETRVRDLEATGPAGELAPFLALAAAWSPEGTVAIRSDEFAAGSGGFRGKAQVTWTDAALSLSPVRPLGTWKMDVEGRGAAAEIAVATVKGPLRIAGKGQWAKEGTAPERTSFSGEARAESGREKDLEAILALIGPKRPDGAHAIEVR